MRLICLYLSKIHRALVKNQLVLYKYLQRNHSNTLVPTLNPNPRRILHYLSSSPVGYLPGCLLFVVIFLWAKRASVFWGRHHAISILSMIFPCFLAAVIVVIVVMAHHVYWEHFSTQQEVKYLPKALSLTPPPGSGRAKKQQMLRCSPIDDLKKVNFSITSRELCPRFVRLSVGKGARFGSLWPVKPERKVTTGFIVALVSSRRVLGGLPRVLSRIDRPTHRRRRDTAGVDGWTRADSILLCLSKTTTGDAGKWI